MNLQNKTALVTGGSEGLGLEISRLLLKQGAEVIICARNKDKLDIASKELNSPKLRTMVCDVTNFKQVELLVKNIAKLDILINNAGLYIEGALINQKPQDISNVLDVNLKGLIYVTKVCLPLLMKQSEAYIVNVASTKGIEVAKDLSVYSASKWGVRGFTKSLQKDLEDTDIKVFGFYPASMKTNFHSKAGVEKNKQNWMTAKDAAESVIFAISRPAPQNYEELIIRNK